MKPTDSNRSTMYCRKCSCVLDGLDTDHCPECGRPFDRRNPKTFCDRPKGKWRIRRLLRDLAIDAMSLVALSILVWIVRRLVTGHQLCNELTLIRKAGQPLTFEELLSRTKQADPDKDAGSLYVDTISAHRAGDFHELTASEKAADLTIGRVFEPVT